jgi:dethiobiotin synthetase
VEGCGGLLTPLGEDYTLMEVIRAIGGHTVVVAPNRLGSINQVMLVVRALQGNGIRSAAVALMNVQRTRTLAVRTNADALSRMLGFHVPTIRHLVIGAGGIQRLSAHSKNLQKTLAGLLPSDTVCALSVAAVSRSRSGRRVERQP